MPAYAGIPLTHRDYTSTVAFITGHEEPGKKESDIAWEKLSTGAGTLVFLMGAGNLPLIAERLMHYGRPPDTPAAVIRRGTVAEQRTVAGTLKNIAELIREKDIKPPAIIIIGDVVNLRTELDWFEKRPLFGKRIVVTRAREQASAFLKKLTGLGAECIEFPTIKIVPPRTWDMLDKSIKSINSYDWLLFTSVNGVKYFFNRLDTLGKDVRDLHGLKIGAIGPKTAGELQNFGIKPELMPDEYRAEAVVASFEKYGVRGAKILVPRAAVAREILPDELKKIGAEVDVAPAYETVIPDDNSGWIREMLEKGNIDMVTFTSSSTVNNFVEALKADNLELQKSMENVVVACIGPITADTARKNGLNADLVPSDYTIEGLTGEIINYFSS